MAAVVSAQDYVREALAVLGEQGGEALTIAVLCDRLDVTKGSFYHHFGGLPGFVDVLLESWEREAGRGLGAVTRAYPDPGERLAALVELLVEAPHATEAALRGWPAASEVVQRVDRRRERALAEAMTAYGVEREQARVLARLAVNAVVGAQHREQPVDVRRLWQLFEEFDRLL